MTVQDTSLFNDRAEGISYFSPQQIPASGSIDASEKTVPILFQPLKIRDLELQNRIMVWTDMRFWAWNTANIL